MQLGPRSRSRKPEKKKSSKVTVNQFDILNVHTSSGAGHRNVVTMNNSVEIQQQATEDTEESDAESVNDN